MSGRACFLLVPKLLKKQKHFGKNMPVKLSAPSHVYEIQEVLGESPFNKVYLACRKDKSFKVRQLLVIKTFKQKNSSAWLLHTESLLRARHSSHLVKALSFETFKGRPALILEYIKGLNLKELIRKSPPLSKNEAFCICSQVLSGLKELKNIGLSHGDLSLSNILTDTKGRVYLTDYGTANYKEGFYGTKPFTAPELYEKEESLGFASDLFSLGVLEKILTGDFTQKELNKMESRDFIRKGDPLLSAQPQKRKEKEFCFSPKAFFHLGKKTERILFVKNCLPGAQRSKKILKPGFLAKKNPEFAKPAKKWKIFPLGAFAAFLLSANPFISYGKYSPPLYGKSAQIIIRTQKWVHIQMAGFHGYTPLSIPVGKPGAYKLRWKAKGKAGAKYIHVKAGQKLVLKDHDFF